jgi:hypothetical protein
MTKTGKVLAHFTSWRHEITLPWVTWFNGWPYVNAGCDWSGRLQTLGVYAIVDDQVKQYSGQHFTYAEAIETLEKLDDGGRPIFTGPTFLVAYLPALCFPRCLYRLDLDRPCLSCYDVF